MKYLKYFANAQEAQQILSNWHFKTLSSIAGQTGASINQAVPVYPPNSKIYYKTKNSTVAPVGSGPWGNLTVVSNTYTDGWGVVQLSDAPTRMYSFFSSTYNIVDIIIPDSVTSIDKSIFAQNTTLKHVTFPSGLTTINNDAFDSCSALTGDIILSDTLQTIGSHAFRACTKLTSITCLAITPPKCIAQPFGSATYTIYVPAASLDAYKAAAYWSSVADRIQAIQ